jgi:hypothetical protein
LEAVRNVIGGLDLKTSTRLGKIANGARQLVTPEKYLAGFDGPKTERPPPIFHSLAELRLMAQPGQFAKCQA